MRKIYIVLLVLIVLLIAGGAYLFWNSEKVIAAYRPQLESMVGNALDRDVKFQKISFSLLPKARIVLSEIDIARGNPEDPYGTIKSIELELKLRPLLRKELIITSLVLNNPDIIISKRDVARVSGRVDGADNMFRVITVADTRRVDSDIKGRFNSDSSDTPLVDIQIEGIRINNGSYSEIDLHGAKKSIVSKLDLDAVIERVSGDLLISNLDSKMRIVSAQDLSMTAAELKYDIDSGSLNLPNVIVKSFASTISVSGALNIKNQDGELKLTGNSIDLNNFPLALLNTKDISFLSNGELSTIININLLPGFKPVAKGTANIKNLALKAHGLELKPVQGKINFDATLERQKITLSDFTADLPGQGAKVNINGELLLPNKSGLFKISTGVVKIKSFEQILYNYAPQLEEYDPSGDMQLSLDVRIDPNLSQPKVSGTIKVDQFASRFQQYSIGIATTQLRLSQDERGANLIKMQDLPLVVNDHQLVLSGDLIHTPTAFYIRELTGSGFAGSFNGGLKVAYGSQGNISARLNATNINLSQVLSLWDKQAAYKLTGTLAKLSAEIEAPTGNRFLEGMQGSLNGELVNGVIKDLNLAREVLQKIQGLPFLSGSLVSRVPPEFNRYLEPNDTRIHSLKSLLTIASGKFSSKDIQLVSDLFTASADGTFTLDSNIRADGVVYFEPQFSTLLVQKVKELDVVLNRQGMLVVPLQVRGRIPDVQVTPDLEGLLKASVGKKLEQEAGKFLQQLIAPSKGPPSQQDGSADTTQ